MTTVRDAIALAEAGRTDAARQAFARRVADGAPQAHKSYAIFLQQRGESDATLQRDRGDAKNDWTPHVARTLRAVRIRLLALQ